MKQQGILTIIMTFIRLMPFMHTIYRYTGLLLASCVFFSTPVLASEITVQVLDNGNKPLRGIVVYLEATDGKYSADIPPREVTVYQKDKKFTPYITVKSMYDVLVFENQDNLTHHIFTVLSKDISFRLKKNEVVRNKQILKEGKALMACNIHDWMAGYVFTVDTPYYGKTNDNGELRFALPDQKEFTIRIWHPQMAKKDSQLTSTIVSKQQNPVVFRLSEEMAEIPTQENDELFEFLEDY